MKRELQTIVFCLFLILTSCKKEVESKLQINQANSENPKFTVLNPILDTVRKNVRYENVIKFNSFKDSIQQAEKLSDSLVTNNTFLFCYIFDSDKKLPERIKDYKEDESSVFLPVNDSIFYDFSFNREGWNRKVLILLEQVYFSVEDEKLRILEQHSIQIDSVFVTN